ncbi:uncharacterized protein CIMG_09631 [Coccidioides immitis RS]|uniref:Uncharacterized protein n=2 Tax=Coccidioides immitis TaxID=5501 RepID=J3K2T1_COCIM|nr:uncharacterized protein CIMG_09631 [Coccidioides immitis RS]EAS28427.3 hypothetical protein CIMG_09631 [Coccidioides immitis RS]KMU77166.1 hypothetical protein CISG_06010 [Coccidioides immitis RMSCC 3703]TPX23250.1 hypothetical protein DIZ76_012576 [Coccidioides immitis]
MKPSINIALLLSISVFVSGQADTCSNPPQSDKVVQFADALKVICPNSAREPCINDPKAPHQCRSASQAAEPILRSFEKYNITNKNEMAALVSLMALESDEFKYQKNVFPGRPGQGTRNMQMPKWNARYLASIPELKDQREKVGDDKAKILDLLLSKDDYDFGSAAWYMTSQCTSDVRKGLQDGKEDGWEKYITACVGTTASGERLRYWQVAVKEMQKL